MTIPGCLVAPMLASGRKELSFHGNATDTSNSSSYTFSAQTIGTASADRRVIVGVHMEGARSITSATIGGVSATIVIQGGGSGKSGILIAAVPTGTTADVVITLPGSNSSCAIGVWSVTGMTSDTAVDTGDVFDDPAADTLSTANGGICIAVATRATIGNVNWTGATEVYDDTDGSSLLFSGASAQTTGESITISANFSGSGDGKVLFATW